MNQNPAEFSSEKFKYQRCILNQTTHFWHRRIQRDLEASIPIWVPKLSDQKSFLVQYILSSIHSDQQLVNTQGFHGLNKPTIIC